MTACQHTLEASKVIPDLKPYPAMKDSSVTWLGMVPEHWCVVPGRACFRVAHMPNTELVENTVLSLSYGQIVVKPEDKLHGLVPASFETYQIVEPGDIICRPTDLQNDKTSLRFGFSGSRGIITSAYICLRTLDCLNKRFGYYLLHTYDLKKIFYGLGSGLRQNLDWQDFKTLPCLLPPLSEQAAIIRFLDHADQQIRCYIHAKQKLIKLLEEQKQVIIHRAVTRGLDPNVRLKPSGVEWLGNIPVDWKIIRFKFVAAKIVDCLHATPKYSENGEFPAIRTADISPGIIHISSARRIESEEYARWIERLEPRSGDILYSREGERFGIAACVPDGVNLCISQRMMIFRIRPEYDPVYVMWLLNGKQIYAQACKDVMGATAPHVNVSTIRNYFLALPDHNEQKMLVAEIDDLTRGLNGAISSATREIALIREYRTRLISDVVTGKLDVRSIELPAINDIEAPMERDGLLGDELDSEDQGIQEEVPAEGD